MAIPERGSGPTDPKQIQISRHMRSNMHQVAVKDVVLMYDAFWNECKTDF